MEHTRTTILLLQLKVIFFWKISIWRSYTDNNSMLLTYGGQLIVFAICAIQCAFITSNSAKRQKHLIYSVPKIKAKIATLHHSSANIILQQ